METSTNSCPVTSSPSASANVGPIGPTRINEVLAEKTRALVERHGRARDVYDVVNISRNVRDEINAETARDQLPILAPVETFSADLRDAIAWWLEPAVAEPVLPTMPQATGNRPSRPLFPTYSWRSAPSNLEQIRYAARNRLCALVTYKGVQRLVEPYSLRYPATGNQLLHVHEVQKNGRRSNTHKAFITSKITSASVSNIPFTPRWFVEQ